MKPLLITYAATLGTLLVADVIWLALVARTFYRDQLGELMLPSPNLMVTSLFYLFFAAAIVLLAVTPAVKASSLSVVLLYGAVLGLAAYGTYDVTNIATLKNWPLKMSLVDMAWGTFVTALSATGGYLAATSLSQNGAPPV